MEEKNRKSENDDFNEEDLKDSRINKRKLRDIHEKRKSGRKFHFSFAGFKFLILLAAFAFVCGGGYFFASSLKLKRVKAEHANLTSEILKVAEFTVIKNQYANIAAVKAEVLGGFSKAYNIVKYNGVIRIGVKNASDIDVVFSKDGKSVTVYLPHCEILGNDITSMESFDERRGLFVSVDTQMVFDEIKVSKQETLDNLIVSGVLNDADIQLKTFISGFLSTQNFQEIKFQWKL